MTTLLYSHSACSDHDPGAYHPENPGRLAAIESALEGPAFAELVRREAPRASLEQIGRVHPGDFAEQILAAVPAQGHAAIDGDTVMSPGSGEAALRAAGAVVAAVDAVARGEADNAFCAVRPPGHHAEPVRAMGFCLFNSVAVGALQAREVHGLERVAVFDFDVHHGNGTQAAFWHDRDLFYASTHQYPLYPGTGSASERGVSGNVLNRPLPPGAGSDMFRDAVTETILPGLRTFAPDLLIISAGFDAHEDDPLAGLAFTDEDYAWVTDQLTALAADCCDGRLVSALEGGYDHAALGRSVAAHVKALMAA
ncbi:MAG: histone deacetylase family protein [Pseudomonadota bacterium]